MLTKLREIVLEQLNDFVTSLLAIRDFDAVRCARRDVYHLFKLRVLERHEWLQEHVRLQVMRHIQTHYLISCNQPFDCSVAEERVRVFDDRLQVRVEGRLHIHRYA